MLWSQKEMVYFGNIIWLYDRKERKAGFINEGTPVYFRSGQVGYSAAGAAIILAKTQEKACASNKGRV